MHSAFACGEAKRECRRCFGAACPGGWTRHRAASGTRALQPGNSKQGVSVGFLGEAVLTQTQL